MNWISTKERMPLNGEYVLCWIPNRPWVDKSSTVFATVMKRFQYDRADYRYPLYGWDRFGPGGADGPEVTHWAKIEIPNKLEVPQ